MRTVKVFSLFRITNLAKGASPYTGRFGDESSQIKVERFLREIEKDLIETRLLQYILPEGCGLFGVSEKQ